MRRDFTDGKDEAKWLRVAIFGLAFFLFVPPPISLSSQRLQAYTCPNLPVGKFPFLSFVLFAEWR
jgi:hypothetical protein